MMSALRLDCCICLVFL